MGEETKPKDDGAAAATPAAKKNVDKNKNKDDNEFEDPMSFWVDKIEESAGGWLRGVAVATRKLALVTKKVIIAKGPAAKQAVRQIGQNRPLAFTSEGAVAGQSLIPKIVYYGAWGLSGVAISADIYSRYDDAPEDKKWNTVLYWTSFHIPASLLVPAYIIHQVVHTVEHAVENPKGMAKAWSARTKSIAPVAAAILSIGPVVPMVDYAAECLLEPTLGAYLGLDFSHHQHLPKKLTKQLTHRGTSQKKDESKEA